MAPKSVAEAFESFPAERHGSRPWQLLTNAFSFDEWIQSALIQFE